MMDFFKFQIAVGASGFLLGFVTDGDNSQNLVFGLEIEQLAQILSCRNTILSTTLAHLHPAGSQPLVFCLKHNKCGGNRGIFNPNIGF